MLKPNWFTEGYGWVGVVFILAAYALLTFGVLDSDNWIYHALNAVGSVGIVIDALAQKNWQPAVLNVVWLGLATFGILSSLGFSVPSVPPGEEPDTASEADAWNNAFVTQDAAGELRYPSDMEILDTDQQEPFHYLATVDMALGSELSTYNPINYSQDGRVVVAHEKRSSDACFTVPETAGEATFATEETFGNATWKVATFSGAAAGSRYDTTLYRAMRKGTCYEIVETIHYASDWTDVDMAAIENSLDELHALLDSVVKTFTFVS